MFACLEGWYEVRRQEPPDALGWLPAACVHVKIRVRRRVGRTAADRPRRITKKQRHHWISSSNGSSMAATMRSRGLLRLRARKMPPSVSPPHKQPHYQLQRCVNLKARSSQKLELQPRSLWLLSQSMLS